jgi:hypothetical protein
MVNTNKNSIVLLFEKFKHLTVKFKKQGSEV